LLKIVISAGHGKFVSGAIGIINEVTEARRVVKRVSELLNNNGAKAIEFYEDIAKTQKDNVNNIINFHNRQDRDLDVSVHFNSSAGTTTAPIGVEVLYKSLNPYSFQMAQRLSTSISFYGELKNRGAKPRADLGFLNSCTKNPVLIEVCFVNSTSDVNAYNKNFEQICKGIAEVLLDKEISEREDEDMLNDLIASGYTENEIKSALIDLMNVRRNGGDPNHWTIDGAKYLAGRANLDIPNDYAEYAKQPITRGILGAIIRKMETPPPLENPPNN